MQHHMDAAHGGIAQSGFFLFLYLSQPTIALQIVVELLQVTGGELIQRDIPDSRDDMLFNVPVVVVHGGWANVRLGIQIKPRPQPSGKRVFIGAATSNAWLSSMAFFSFALHSACVLPSTFLMMRFPVSG